MANDVPAPKGAVARRGRGAPRAYRADPAGTTPPGRPMTEALGCVQLRLYRERGDSERLIIEERGDETVARGRYESGCGSRERRAYFFDRNERESRCG